MKLQVRIALVINEHGKWNAFGWSEGSDEDVLSTALDGFDEPGQCEQTYWLVAHVDVPEPRVVSASVVNPSPDLEAR